ncbi:unnamed protein product [Closterium sp. NIES-54]
MSAYVVVGIDLGQELDRRMPTSQAVRPADIAFDDDDAETLTAPQAAVAAQHQGVSTEGGHGGGGGNTEAGAGRKEKESEEELEESESELEYEEEENEAVKEKDEKKDDFEEDEEEEELEYEVEYEDGTVEVGAVEKAGGLADDENKEEEDEDDDADKGMRLADLGKEKEEVGVEASAEKGKSQEEAAYEGSGKNAASWLLDVTLSMSTTVTENITANIGEAWEVMKHYAEKASAWLDELDDPEGCLAVERAKVVTALANHVEAVVDGAKLGLEDYISKHLAAAQTNIAAAVTRNIAVLQPPLPQPTPPAPTPAFPDELMKLFKADVLKAVTEATQ